jgi:hypothetical protein
VRNPSGAINLDVTAALFHRGARGERSAERSGDHGIYFQGIVAPED